MNHARIALCLSGYVGTKNKFPHKEDKEYIDINEGKQYILDNIIGDYNVDIFVHSFDISRKEEIINAYNPVDYIIEEQKKDFLISENEKGVIKNNFPLDKTIFNCQSQYFSKKRVLEIKKTYEVANNFTYDWVFLTRFDMAFLRKFEYEKLDNSKFYLAEPIHDGKYNDFYFLSNSKNMDLICGFYEKMKDCGFPTISNSVHSAIYEYIKKIGLSKNVVGLFERPWGSPKWSGDIRLLRTKN